MPLGLAHDVAGVGAATRFCAPPPWFRGVEGVRSAWPDAEGPFGRPPRISGSQAQRAGKRYERKALAWLQRHCGEEFHSHLWFRFQPHSGPIRWCQPDGVWQSKDGRIVVLFEVKVRFTSDAWWQLRRLYEPVVRAALKPKAFAVIVMCKSFDPSTAYPEPIYPVSPPLLSAPLGAAQTGVLVWPTL